MAVVMTQRDFIGAAELGSLTGFSLSGLYSMHATGRGALAPILTKLGSRIGVWRLDYERFVAANLKFKAPAITEQRHASA